MKVLESTQDKVQQMRDLFEQVIHGEQSNTATNLMESTKPSDEETLRYVIFQMSLKEVATGLSAVTHIIEKTDEEIRAMCEESGLTVHEALKNAKMNMVADLLSDIIPH